MFIQQLIVGLNLREKVSPQRFLIRCSEVIGLIREVSSAGMQ